MSSRSESNVACVIYVHIYVYFKSSVQSKSKNQWKTSSKDTAKSGVFQSDPYLPSKINSNLELTVSMLYTMKIISTHLTVFFFSFLNLEDAKYH